MRLRVTFLSLSLSRFLWSHRTSTMARKQHMDREEMGEPESWRNGSTSYLESLFISYWLNVFIIWFSLGWIFRTDDLLWMCNLSTPTFITSHPIVCARVCHMCFASTVWSVCVNTFIFPFTNIFFLFLFNNNILLLILKLCVHLLPYCCNLS